MDIKNNLLTLVVALFTSLSYADSLVLNGVGIHNDVVDNFLGGLYLEQHTTQADTLKTTRSNFRLEHKIVNNRYSASLWRNYLRKNLLLNTPSDKLEQHQQQLVQLMSLYKGRLQNGDIITISAIGDTTEIKINNHLIHAFPTREIASVLLQGWIGDQAISQSFKHSILGLDKDLNKQIVHYQQLPIKPGREQIGTLFTKQVPELTANSSVATSLSKAEPTIADVAQNTSKKVVPKSKSKVTNNIKPIVKEPKLKETNTVASYANPAPNKTSIPHHEQPPIDTTATGSANKQQAPNTQPPNKFAAGVSNFSQQLNNEQKYQDKLVKAIYQNVRYPSRAVQKDIEGVVQVFFTVQPNGEIAEISAETDSNSSLLKRAAISAVKKAQKSNELTPPATDIDTEVSVAIRFQLTGEKASEAIVAR